MSPTFSVIMTSFNYAPFVGAAIESVLAQTLDDWELLVVDDCSTDDSWAIIQGYKDRRIKAFRQPVNSGACAAYNKALSEAMGRYIACLDSDDIFMPTKLEKQAVFFAAHPDVDICGTFVSEIDNAGHAVAGSTLYADWFNTTLDLNDPSSWLWSNHLCHSSAVVRSDLHKQVGEFDNRLVYTPDWQFWLRCLVQGSEFKLIDEPLVGYRNHGGNITHKDQPAVVKEHAVTSASLLLPWLEQIGRADLFSRVLDGFLQHPAMIEQAHVMEDVFHQFFHSPVMRNIFSEQMCLSVERERQLRKEHKQQVQLKNENIAWLTSQKSAWENVAAERQQQVQLMNENIAWLTSQKSAWENVAAERLNQITALLEQVDQLMKSTSRKCN